MSGEGVLVQETRRGRVHVCAVWSPVVVGTDAAAAQFRLRDRRAEPTHVELTAGFDGELKIRDLSASGVWLNERKIEGEAQAQAGDLLRLGRHVELKVLGLLDPAKPRRSKGLLRVPQRMDRYILLRVVGHGAAGLVYEAYDEQQGRRCAIKLLIAGGRAIPELVERFRREAMLQGRLNDYPGIVSVYDLGTVPDSGELYCVMEFVTGDTLRDRIRNGLPRVEAVRLVARVARAAAYAHERNLIHRDLKPANVMISDKGVIRLTDFGLCKGLESEDGLTATGVMLGTPSYMAPEQIEDAKRVGAEADIYALGAILFVALTGQLPYGGGSVREVIEKVCKGQLTAPRSLDASIDQALETTCLKAMRYEPGDRHASALDFARELEDWARRIDPPQKVTLKLPGKPKRS